MAKKNRGAIKCYDLHVFSNQKDVCNKVTIQVIPGNITKQQKFKICILYNQVKNHKELMT